jgi:RNA polymerase sigma factor (sigma-70 family)
MLFVYLREMEMALKIEFEDVYRREKNRLLAFIRSRVEDPQEAEDILQDVVCKTLEGFSVTSRIDNLIGWLYTATRNRIIDHYRKKKPVTASMDQEETFSIRNLLADGGGHPESLYYRKLIAEAVTDGIAALPEAQRDVIIWQELEGLTFREIAELTGESVNTLISRKRYAMTFLRRRLGDLKPMLDEIQ